MHQNMLNDLAEAMKALDGKKIWMVGYVYPRGAVGSRPKPWTRLRGCAAVSLTGAIQ